MSTLHHLKRKESRRGFEPRSGPSTYHPNALPLGQTGSSIHHSLPHIPPFYPQLRRSRIPISISHCVLCLFACWLIVSEWPLEWITVSIVKSHCDSFLSVCLSSNSGLIVSLVNRKKNTCPQSWGCTSLCTLYLHAYQVRVTVCDLGLRCCTCVTYFER